MNDLSASTGAFGTTGRVTVVVKGALRRSPYRGGVYKAELAVLPMMRPSEYESVAAFERRFESPILLSPTQRCQMLKTLLGEIRAAITGFSFFAVRLYGPENVQLPKELLAEDVLVTHAPLTLVPFLLRSERRNFVVVHHCLRVDAVDRGGNELEVWFFELDPVAAGQVAAYVQESPFFQYFDRVEIRRVGASEARALPFDRGEVDFSEVDVVEMPASC